MNATKNLEPPSDGGEIFPTTSECIVSNASLALVFEGLGNCFHFIFSCIHIGHGLLGSCLFSFMDSKFFIKL